MAAFKLVSRGHNTTSAMRSVSLQESLPFLQQRSQLPLITAAPASGGAAFLAINGSHHGVGVHFTRFFGASSKPNHGPPRKAPHDGPDEETVKRLAEQARVEQKMWDFLVPERNLNMFGCTLLVGAILGLNYYQRQLVRQKEEEDARYRGSDLD